MRTIAKTLNYCHNQGVAHRDLKAENILVGKDRLKIIDFAFATKVDPGRKVDTYCGTPSYMGPEIFSKQPHCPKKADVWALGVLAYRLFVGELPFICKYRITTAENKADKLEVKVREEEFPRAKLDNASVGFISFLEKCLEKDPKLRPSMMEILQDQWLREKDKQFDNDSS